ncbi:hypothetical protein E2C01_088867 [Portunus trituberculatus]|uniref:Uncharacterized protein n=1 Tax=Portunus trituberculatus TaxID=210409 RepID=A0A5B7JKR2_PORTR|nr:hypothetical protein [Portunus trituberculatus]
MRITLRLAALTRPVAGKGRQWPWGGAAVQITGTLRGGAGEEVGTRLMKGANGAKHPETHGRGSGARVVGAGRGEGATEGQLCRLTHSCNIVPCLDG